MSQYGSWPNQTLGGVPVGMPRNGLRAHRAKGQLHVAGRVVLYPERSPATMKIVVRAVVSLALTASLADQVTAAPLRNKKQTHRQHTITKPPRRPTQGSGDYYEHVLDKVPFGSQRWWDIYRQQHNRGGS